MNIVIFSGRPCADPELKYTTNNNAVCSFNLAVDRRDENKSTDFFRCNAWSKTAELLAKYCHKGDKVTIRGRAITREWQDKNQETRKSIEFTVDEVEFSPKTDSAKPAEQQTAKPVEQKKNDYYDLDALDVPF